MGDLNTELQRPSQNNYKFTKEEAKCSPRRTSSLHSVEGDLDTEVGYQSDDGNVADIFKDMDLYRAAKSWSIHDFDRVLERVSEAVNEPFEQILSRVSPAGNTPAHIAVKNGNQVVVSYIAAKYPNFLLRKNINGDTPLHLASKTGDVSIVMVLLPCVKDLPQSTAESADFIALRDSLVKETNKWGNTALHEALKNGREVVARYLIQQDHEMLLYQNKEGESALYLAVEAGFAGCAAPAGCISFILECITDVEHMHKRFKGKSPIHAAIMKMNMDVTEAILSKCPNFIELRDLEGRTPLHYAVSLGYFEGVSYLVKKCASSVSKTDKNGLCPIHLASIEGHLDIIKLLLQYCPAAAELLDPHGRSILHIAAKSGRISIVKYILNNPELEELINMKDLDGNSPLHLATIEWQPEIVSILTWDKKVKVDVVNGKGMTPLDLAEYAMSKEYQFRQCLTWTALVGAKTPRSATCEKAVRRRPCHNYAAQLVKERVNTLLLVTTLVATITFAAGFTMPGGYNSAPENPGMATMLSEAGFPVFVFCDTIAMHCSIIAVMLLIFAQFDDPNLVITALNFSLPLLGIALSSMSLAFTAGVFLVVGNLKWLSIAVLVLGLTFLSALLLLFSPLCLPYTSNNRILRRICYYPFCLVILATRS